MSKFVKSISLNFDDLQEEESTALYPSSSQMIEPSPKLDQPMLRTSKTMNEVQLLQATNQISNNSARKTANFLKGLAEDDVLASKAFSGPQKLSSINKELTPMPDIAERSETIESLQLETDFTAVHQKLDELEDP
jgi:hypothetical protein